MVIQLRGKRFAEEAFATLDGGVVVDDVDQFHRDMAVQPNKAFPFKEASRWNFLRWTTFIIDQFSPLAEFEMEAVSMRLTFQNEIFSRHLTRF